MFSLFNFSSIFHEGMQLTPFVPMCGRPCQSSPCKLLLRCHMTAVLQTQVPPCAATLPSPVYIGCKKGKGKVFPYSLPSVGPGADPAVQAVSPQVT